MQASTVKKNFSISFSNSDLWRRPELSCFLALSFVLVLFYINAGDSGMFDFDGIINFTTVSAYLGLLAVGATLLMIGGEFDLSIGSMIGFSSMMVAIPCVNWGWSIDAAVLFAFTASVFMGALNGFLVNKTKLPSFIVTLAFLYILRGLTLAFSIMSTNKTIVSGLGVHVTENSLTYKLFGNGESVTASIPVVVWWWLALVVFFTYVLSKTKWGNWIKASGGDATSSNLQGVPVEKVKLALFMLSAFCACLFSVLQVIEVGSSSADRGVLKEFEAIIAAVIGGTLLTGGHGSVVGGALGALLFGIVQIGITYTDVHADWFRVFLGGMLLVAVLANRFIQKRLGA